jgi:hypothetical protein
MDDKFLIYFLETLNPEHEAEYARYEARLQFLGKYLDTCLGQLKKAIGWAVGRMREGWSDHHVTAIVLGRHVMAQVDGVSLLVRQGCSECCGPLLRSACEAAFGLNYLFAVESEVERKGLSYIVCHFRRQLKRLLELDPGTPEGRQLRVDLAGDKHERVFNRVFPSLPTSIADIQAQLARPMLVPIDAEWQRVYRLNPRKEVHWYSLFGGPGSFRQLAKKAKRYGFYRTYYEKWSGTIHAGDGFENLHTSDEGVEFRPIRHPEGIEAACVLASWATFSGTRRLVEAYAPLRLGEIAAEFHKHIGPTFRRLMTNKLIDLNWPT